MCLSTMASTTCLNDNEFGPVVRGCRDDFDFTVTFELTIFSLFPNSIFILVAIIRCSQLFKRVRLVHARLFLGAKLVSSQTMWTLMFVIARTNQLRSRLLRTLQFIAHD